MLDTTLSAIGAANPCGTGYKKLVNYLGGAKKYGYQTPIPLLTILDSNGIDDALWVAVNILGNQGEMIAHTFACDCAERVLHIYEKHHSDDSRPRNAIAVKRRWLGKEATDEELAAARDAAKAAAGAAARADARGAAMAAALAAARADARAAALDAAWDAAWAATWAEASAAALDAAWDAAWAAEIKWQTYRLRGLLSVETVAAVAGIDKRSRCRGND